MFDPLDHHSPVVDFGAHLFPEDWTPQSGPLGDIIGPVLTDPERIHERYTEAGIDQVVLSRPPTMGAADAEAVAASNDELLGVVEEYSDFYGLASVPTAAGGEAAAAELERSLENGFHGGAVETMSDGIELTDPAVEPIFEVADEYGAPLLVHPKIHNSLHEAVDVLSDEHKLNSIFGRETALAGSISKLIHEGTFEKYPDLNLVFHHLGGNIATMLGRIQDYLEAGRWPGQDGLKPYPEFKRILEERVYVDTSGFAGHRPPLQVACQEFPTSNVVFATDSPFEPRSADELRRYAEQVATVAGQGKTGGILGENALSLLRNV